MSLRWQIVATTKIDKSRVVKPLAGKASGRDRLTIHLLMTEGRVAHALDTAPWLIVECCDVSTEVYRGTEGLSLNLSSNGPRAQPSSAIHRQMQI